jgi:cyclic pyranopterin phosphate synthase
MSGDDLSHLDPSGRARMVDVGSKDTTPRRAVARGGVRCDPALVERLRRDDLSKGSVIEIARLAGIQAAKRTPELIPLCHSVPLDSVRVEIEVEEDGVAIEAEATATWRTGVEMEALTAVAVAALTVYDMGKSIDKAMVIEGVRLVEKSGGAGGDYRAPGEDG